MSVKVAEQIVRVVGEKSCAVFTVGNNENLLNLFILTTIRDDTLRSRRTSFDSLR